MWTLTLSLHIIVCLFIIIVILLQTGKGSDMGAAFGGSSQTVFGPRGGATFLSKMTTIVAIGFLVTSLALAYQSSNRTKSSIIKDEKKVEKVLPKVEESKKAETKADVKANTLKVETKTTETKEDKPAEEKAPEKK